MKKIINAIRDFIYNITDYGLMITVVVIMVSVLIWRFDLLFSKNIEKKVIANIPDTNYVDTNKPDKPVQNNDNPVTEKPDDSKKPDNNDGDNKHNEQSSVIATIEIPQGSFPSKIGDILMNSNLIKDKNAFLNRSVEMGLDTKLQSGTFEIAVGTNLDEVIKIIAKAN